MTKKYEIDDLVFAKASANDIVFGTIQSINTARQGVGYSVLVIDNLSQINTGRSIIPRLYSSNQLFSSLTEARSS